MALVGTTTTQMLPGVAQGSFHLDPTEICQGHMPQLTEPSSKP